MAASSVSEHAGLRDQPADQNRRLTLGYVSLNVFCGGMILNKNLLDENVCARSHALLCHSRVQDKYFLHNSVRTHKNQG